MNDTSFNLAWEPSENDGGSKIIEYIVEIREETETTYRKVGTTLGTVTNIHVEKVVKNKGYLFRIYARNEAGTSEAFETTEKIVVGRKISKFPDILSVCQNSFYFLFAQRFSLKTPLMLIFANANPNNS